MDSDRALRVLRKPEDILNSLPYISGKKIVNDTAQLTFCKLDFRRSFGFDSSGHLSVIGLTHKTTVAQMNSERDCAMQWLVNQLGAPIGENKVDDVRVTFWNVSGAKLTLEAKAYNDRDAFVLIYFYGDTHTP
jgi:hypothetical protein